MDTRCRAPTRLPITTPYRESVLSCPAPSLAPVTDTEPRLRDGLGDEAEVLPAIAGDRGSGDRVAELVELEERTRDYARDSKAANTLRGYESDVRHFAA